jgi:hypothetical protein
VGVHIQEDGQAVTIFGGILSQCGKRVIISWWRSGVVLHDSFSTGSTHVVSFGGSILRSVFDWVAMVEASFEEFKLVFLFLKACCGDITEFLCGVLLETFGDHCFGVEDSSTVITRYVLGVLDDGKVKWRGKFVEILREKINAPFVDIVGRQIREMALKTFEKPIGGGGWASGGGAGWRIEGDVTDGFDSAEDGFGGGYALGSNVIEAFVIEEELQANIFHKRVQDGSTCSVGCDSDAEVFIAVLERD